MSHVMPSSIPICSQNKNEYLQCCNFCSYFVGGGGGGGRGEGMKFLSPFFS